VPVAHTYNPSYSGSKDQEAHGLIPAWANSLRDPISKTPSQKRAGGVARGVSPKFKPQYQKKQKTKKPQKPKKKRKKKKTNKNEERKIIFIKK
jgi:hypothetical protein